MIDASTHRFRRELFLSRRRISNIGHGPIVHATYSISLVAGFAVAHLSWLDITACNALAYTNTRGGRETGGANRRGARE